MTPEIQDTIRRLQERRAVRLADAERHKKMAEDHQRWMDSAYQEAGDLDAAIGALQRGERPPPIDALLVDNPNSASGKRLG